MHIGPGPLTDLPNWRRAGKRPFDFLLPGGCFAGHHATTRSVTMTITITVFERSPDRGKGLARDMRVRWALEEVGQPYDVRLLSFRAMKESALRTLHPFGQIPTYEKS